ncbi:MAG: hypothetical protein ABIO85_06150 [Sphingomicrobium sp.]
MANDGTGRFHPPSLAQQRLKRNQSLKVGRADCHLLAGAKHPRPPCQPTQICLFPSADAIGERPADVGVPAKPFSLEALSRAVANAANPPQAIDGRAVA